MNRPWFQTVLPLLAHQRTVWGLCFSAILAGCATKVEPPKPPPAAVVPAAPVAVAPVLPQPALTSQAATPRDYRRDAATHLYSLNTSRIFQGKMPPLLYAVGVLQVDIDRMGQVTDIRWMRAPSQAPEVMAEIERSVRLAAPYPAPVRMGRVTYTDTWLWHKSGRFQLDTLTEGQY
jgi:periplasmic protein TonB